MKKQAQIKKEFISKCPKALSGKHQWSELPDPSVYWENFGDYGKRNVLAYNAYNIDDFKPVCRLCGMVDDTFKLTEKQKIHYLKKAVKLQLEINND